MIAKLLIETDLENGQKGLAVSPKSWRHIADIAMEYRAAWSKTSFLCRFQYKTGSVLKCKKNVSYLDKNGHGNNTMVQ